MSLALLWSALAGDPPLFNGSSSPRALPAKFVRADPIKVCVSQNGSITGADPGSTQGAAILYLVSATPV